MPVYQVPAQSAELGGFEREVEIRGSGRVVVEGEYVGFGKDRLARDRMLLAKGEVGVPRLRRDRAGVAAYEADGQGHGHGGADDHASRKSSDGGVRSGH